MNKFAIPVFVILTVSAVIVFKKSQDGAEETRVTSPHLVAIQEHENALQQAIAEKEALSAELQRANEKLATTQMRYNLAQRQVEEEHAKELAALVSTKNQYASLWEAARKPVPFYKNNWFIGSLTFIIGVVLVNFVNWTKAAYGGFWRWFRQTLNRIPRIRFEPRAAH